MKAYALLLLACCAGASFVQQRCFPFEVGSYHPAGLSITAKQNSSLLIYPLSAIHRTTIPRVIDTEALDFSGSGFFLCTDELVEKGVCGVEERGKFQYQCTTEDSDCGSGVSQHIINAEDKPQDIFYSVGNGDVYCVVAVQPADTTADAVTIEEHHTLLGEFYSTPNAPLGLLEVVGYYYIIGCVMTVSPFAAFRGTIKDLIHEKSSEKGAPVDLRFAPYVIFGFFEIIYLYYGQYSFTLGIFDSIRKLDHWFSCIWMAVGYYYCFAHDGYSESILWVPLYVCWWVYYVIYCVVLVYKWYLLPHTGSMTYQKFQSMNKDCGALISLCWVFVWGLNCYMIWRRVQKLVLPESKSFKAKYDKTLCLVLSVCVGFPLLSLLAQAILQVPIWYNGGGFYFYLAGDSLWQILFPDEGPFERPTTQNFVFQFLKHITRHQTLAFIVGLGFIWPELDCDASNDRWLREYHAEQERQQRGCAVCPSCSTRVRCQANHQTV